MSRCCGMVLCLLNILTPWLFQYLSSGMKLISETYRKTRYLRIYKVIYAVLLDAGVARVKVACKVKPMLFDTEVGVFSIANAGFVVLTPAS